MTTQSTLPKTDGRNISPPVNLDTHRAFTPVNSLPEWEALKARVRRQVLVSCGLYPLPRKLSLRARLSDAIEREGYSVQNVLLQTHPGFYLAGNLYRPRGRTGPFPGILGPHGHFDAGRLTHNERDSTGKERGSHKARGVAFARQGYVAFLYDMIGYNDTRQVDHRFANDNSYWLWGISNFGLQTWNSIRALDFLESLLDVDPSRIAISGESGGGTQTMMLGAVDDRLAATAPLVMVSHTMQGGCICENAPGLRVDFSNMEVAATVAPKPQLLVAATGDWTKTTMTVEGPSVGHVYDLYGAAEQFEYTIFDAPHNIRWDTREAVYAFFGKHLLGETDASRLKEQPFEEEHDEDLLFFSNDAPLPRNAKNADEMTAFLKEETLKQLEHDLPKNIRTLKRFKDKYLPLWQATLMVEHPDPTDLLVERGAQTVVDDISIERLAVGRKGHQDRVELAVLTPAGSPEAICVVAHPDGIAGVLTASGAPTELATDLLDRNYTVVGLDGFLTGASVSELPHPPFGVFFTTYNRTAAQQRVQDLLTTSAYLRTRSGEREVVVLGVGSRGPIALLAAPAFDGCTADCHRLNLKTDTALLEPEMYIPGLRKMGDFVTAAALAAPNKLSLYNTGTRFTPARRIEQLYNDLQRRIWFHKTADDMLEKILA
jgi:hypothetical protein